VTKEASSTLDIRRAKAMARRIIEHHFDRKPRRVVHQASGLSNFVFMVYHDEGDFIVRLSPEPAKIQAYIKEQWAMGVTREAGVPTPEILEVGNTVVPIPYMVSRRVVGREAHWHPNRLQILREMGRYAALINAIPTSGFGSTFDWSSNQLSRQETWKEFLHKELNLEERMQTLARHKMLPPKHLKQLRSILEGAARGHPKPSLNHGDIRLKNVIVTEDGQITSMIDWEDCTSNVSPHWELSIALHDLSVDEKQEFLAGYGIEKKKAIEIAPLMKAFNVINYAPEIDRLAAVKDDARMEQYRTRLSGALDLYSF
jgi:aminoglycoside phosphotransferase (APT) family kinase protein